MGQTGQALIAQLRFTDSILRIAISDMTDATARTRTREGKGPSIAWTVGHLLAFRHHMLQVLGETTTNPFDAMFGRVGATAGGEYPSLDELTTAWTKTHQTLEDALVALSDETLAGRAAAAWPGRSSLLEDLAVLTWHETYHMGALGAIRTSLGLSPTLERAAEEGLW